ncbi:protein phosphatase PP2A regulatory subunit A, putative [Entamoeba invadens IP1]|uniref:Protein phosphatase PP2A regulatory subunit A, putative n=1 Tax=Entamoeba invadens IP1 TaxID=370355 RepID=A0A0A1UBW1_ENTIV|nr:protein phosphatase PP2A regulatory subunit A, putative [Entamoeba invadens IP1]ELP92701.1 protein phosphatase PP2A regulatory subunit A, putative [Entamoeba invadens IP1]|eukprot:XP_004259472.1 protein phosphatase PP2A regulatory subunit A, putative [Entamoeba invadens IP1]
MESLTYLPVLLPELDISTVKMVLVNLEHSLYEEEELDLFASDQLTQFAQILGQNEIQALFPFYNVLLGASELNIREKATTSFGEMVMMYPTYDYMPFIKDLCNVSIYGKISAVKLIALVPESKESFSILKTLSTEKFPPIRKAMSVCVEKLHNFPKEIIDVLFKDPIDSVRVGFARCLPLLCRKEENKSYFMTLAKDVCWHVRYVCAVNIGKCCDAFPGDALSDDIQEITFALLNDEDDQVRAMAASHIADITKKIPPEIIINKILPLANKLAEDPVVDVRSSLAEAITQLAPQIGKANCQKYLFKTIDMCLQDEKTEVQLKIITTLDYLNHVMVLSQLSQKVLQTVMRLVNDQNWRCRLQTIELIPDLLLQLQECHFELIKVSVSVLTDKVYAIRIKAIENIKKLLTSFGIEWVKSKILPSVISLANSPLYLHRTICLNCISQIIPSLSVETITTIVIPITLKLLSDKVPNVRFNAIKTFVVCLPLVTPNVIQTRIKPALVACKTDKDPDVVLEVGKALDGVNQFLC